MTTANTAFLADMIAKQTAYVAELEALLADTPNVLVLQFATNGMCVNVDGPQVTNVLKATRFPVAIISTGAPHVRNGVGEVAVLTTLADAAQRCLEQAKGGIELLEKSMG